MKKYSRAAKSVKTLVIYRPKKGKERQLAVLVERHWRTLRKVGLATAEPAVVYRAKEGRSGETIFVEVFSWKDSKSSAQAHETPEVQKIWGPMMPLLKEMSHAVVK